MVIKVYNSAANLKTTEKYIIEFALRPSQNKFGNQLLSI